MATSDMGDSQTSASSASGATIDWAAAFQSPEFLSGLQTAIAGVTTSTPRLEQLEQLGDSIPSQPSTSAISASGNLPVAQGAFHAPTFVTAVNGSVPEPIGSSIPRHQPPNELHTINVSPLASSLPAPNIALGPEKAFSLGPGRAPIPPKLVTKILSSKFVGLSELLPENLDDPLSDTTSFTIENSTIVPVSRPSRERKTDLDILSWVECFNSYISVIATYRPHRARDLLAYMALIIRTAKRFGGKAWFHYDRAFRREAEVNNVQDWSVMRTDLYNFHTSAATRAPDVHPYIRHRATRPVNRGEATGSPNSPQFCLSWNEGSCISPRATCRFRHACNIGGCGQSHRRINHHNAESRDKRRRSPERAHRRSTSRSKN